LKLKIKGLPESKRFMFTSKRKLLKLMSHRNGMTIATWRVPVMYRLLGSFRPARKNSRRSARATAKEAADRPREPVEGAMEITIAHNLLGGQ
jgi:hypothetical protein